MTTNRTYADDEGEFAGWSAPEPRQCPGCKAEVPVRYRSWESSDGAYEDYQYRCEPAGHVWWVDGIDS